MMKRLGALFAAILLALPPQARADPRLDNSMSSNASNATLPTARTNLGFGPSVSIMDYGADPTGVASSDSAFNSCVTSGHDCRLPAGTYLLACTTYTAVTQGITLFGDNASAVTLKFPSSCAVPVNGLFRRMNVTGLTIDATNTSGTNVNIISQTGSLASWNPIVDSTRVIHLQAGENAVSLNTAGNNLYQARVTNNYFQADARLTGATLTGGGAGTGAGYAAGNVLTLVRAAKTGFTADILQAGASEVPAQITVNTVDGGGGILTFSVTTAGLYTNTMPAAFTVTGGAGTGATFGSPTYDITAGASAIPNCVLMSENVSGIIQGSSVIGNKCINSAILPTGLNSLVVGNEIAGNGMATAKATNSYSITISWNSIHDMPGPHGNGYTACIENWARNSTVVGNILTACNDEGIDQIGMNSTVVGNTISAVGAGGVAASSIMLRADDNTTYRPDGSIISDNTSSNAITAGGYGVSMELTGTATNLPANVTIGPNNSTGDTKGPIGTLSSTSRVFTNFTSTLLMKRLPGAL